MSLKKWAPYMLSKLLKMCSHHALRVQSLRFERTTFIELAIYIDTIGIQV